MEKPLILKPSVFAGSGWDYNQELKLFFY